MFRTHLTKQDSMGQRVGKERVSSFYYMDNHNDNADDDNNDGDAEGDDDDDDVAGEGGGAGGGCRVRLPLCRHISKSLQRTF